MPSSPLAQTFSCLKLALAGSSYEWVVRLKPALLSPPPLTWRLRQAAAEWVERMAHMAGGNTQTAQGFGMPWETGSLMFLNLYMPYSVTDLFESTQLLSLVLISLFTRLYTVIVLS